jgi:FAD/FMN-containing dehydrogenase
MFDELRRLGFIEGQNLTIEWRADEPGDPVAAAYGTNYRRLRELKRKYDPKNFFRMNQNIKPLA